MIFTKNSLAICCAMIASSSANACWTCNGSSEEECKARIEESRHETAAQMAVMRERECVGKEEGVQPIGFGISTAGMFSVYCSGKGTGCMLWGRDDMGQPRNQFFPLGQGKRGPLGCGEMEQAFSRPRSSEPGDSQVAQLDGNEVAGYTGEDGIQVVFLDSKHKRP